MSLARSREQEAWKPFPPDVAAVTLRRYAVAGGPGRSGDSALRIYHRRQTMAWVSGTPPGAPGDPQGPKRPFFEEKWIFLARSREQEAWKPLPLPCCWGHPTQICGRGRPGPFRR